MATRLRKHFRRAAALFLSLLTFAAVCPLVSATTPIELTEANVTTFPTVSGTIYAGQKIGDAINNKGPNGEDIGLKLSGGVVTYNGATVEGTFSFHDPNAFDVSVILPKLDFTPENDKEFTSFTVSSTRLLRPVRYDTTVPVNLVLLDETNLPKTVEKTVVSGTKLADIAIAFPSGTVCNEYASSITYNMIYEWRNPETVVTESGYYEAYIPKTKTYNEFVQNIYVTVDQATIPFAIIEENPTIEPIDYSPVATKSSFVVTGGRANVPGTFSIAPDELDKPLSTTVNVIFTPDDLTKAQPVTIKINDVQINPIPCFFGDDEGNPIIPKISMKYGATIDYIPYEDLRAYSYPRSSSTGFNFKDPITDIRFYPANYMPTVGTHRIKVAILTSSTFYTKAIAEFDLEVMPREVEASIGTEIDRNTGKGTLAVIGSGGAMNFHGTFDIYVDGKLLKDNLAFREETPWEAPGNGEYKITAVYHPSDKDNYVLTKEIGTTLTIKLPWTLKIYGSTLSSSDPETQLYTQTYIYSSTAPRSLLVHAQKPEKSYYVFNGWVVTEGSLPDDVDLSAETINLIFPDCDLTIEATYKFSFKAFLTNLFEPIVNFFALVRAAISELINKGS